VRHHAFGEVCGVAADGREIVLQVTPLTERRRTLDEDAALDLWELADFPNRVGRVAHCGLIQSYSHGLIVRFWALGGALRS
jgi:hypothetical protein